MSSRVDDRTMHELYLWPFADSVKAAVASVMCSYNKINGPSCPFIVLFVVFYHLLGLRFLRLLSRSLTHNRDMGM